MFAREYELIYVVRPDVTDDDVAAILERTSKVITDNEGTVLLVDEWGSRKLAYEIKRYNKGNFLFLSYLADAALVAEIERTLRIDDKILRYLTVKVSDRVDVDTRVAEEELKKVAAEAVPTAAEAVAGSESEPAAAPAVEHAGA